MTALESSAGVPAAAEDVLASPAASPFRLSLRRFMHHRLAVAGLVVGVLLVIVAIFAPLIAPFDPNAVDLAQYNKPPGGGHLLGTDQAGRDVLSRLIYGARVSLTVGITAAISAGGFGLILGLCAGFLGGWMDSFVARITEAVLSFPALILMILLVAVLGPSVTTIVIVIALTQWPTSCRIARQETRAVREMDFVLAARATGCSDFTLMLRHILPAVLSPLTVAVTLLCADAILLEAALSFLGLGVNPPQASWGGMLQAAQSLTTLSTQLWLWLPPGIVILVTALSINFIGDGLRDALDARQRA